MIGNGTIEDNFFSRGKTKRVNVYESIEGSTNENAREQAVADSGKQVTEHSARNMHS